LYSTGDGAYTFPATSIVERAQVGEDVSKRIMGPASATDGHFFKADGTTGKKATAAAITSADIPFAAQKTQAATNIYVDVGGNDGNAGTAGAPKLTIQGAIDYFRNNAPYIIHACEIRIGAGTYELTSALDVSGLIVRGSLTLIAQSTADAPLYTAGTAGAGAAATITLQAGTSWADHFWNDAWIYIWKGTGEGQFRAITDSAAADPCICTVAAWTTQPDNTSCYVICHPIIHDNNALSNALLASGIANLAVKGLHFKDFESYGIAISGGSGHNIENNLIQTATGRGISMSLTQGTVYRNGCYVKEYGITVGANSYCTVYYNSLVRNGAAGTGYGVYATQGGVAGMSATAANRNYFQDWAAGIKAIAGGIVTSGTSQTFSTCTADYDPAAAADPAYIS
jgi:hypothetical protein